MLLQFLASFRDYCFNETKNSRDEAYAEGAHILMFIFGTIFYFLPIPIIGYLILFNITNSLHQAMKHDLVLRFGIGILMVIAAISFGKKIYNLVDHVPIRKNWSKLQLRQLRMIYIIFMLFGIIFFYFSLCVTDYLLRHLF